MSKPISLSEHFQRASQMVHLLPTKPSDEELLQLYGLYKQATVGNCNTQKPTALFDIKGKRKWESWNANSNVSSEEAKKQYILKVQSLISSVTS